MLLRIASFALLWLGSCVTLEYEHRVVNAKVPKEAAKSLQPGTHDLGDCLRALGAPVYVWEWSGDGVALGYGAYDHRHWGVGARINVTESASASFNYDDVGAKTRGYVLFFDSSLKLSAVRSGYLRDLTVGLGRRRPSLVED